jgi:GDPmannose 4,6-dehydratase
MKILITGISGQDGIFLTKLIKNTYSKFSILGISRSMTLKNFLPIIENANLHKLQNINLVDVRLENQEEVDKLIKDFRPDYLFNLTGPSSVYESIKKPELEFKITKVFDNLIEANVKNNNLCNFYQASSSEMFGQNNKLNIYNENSEFKPNSPYASGKYTNHEKIKHLREKYEWNIYSGIMFNHESEYRKDDFLFMKIIQTAYKIKNHTETKLKLGSLNYCRDWSYAEDIVEGMLALTSEGSEFDYVLGSGNGTKIQTIVENVFNYFDLDYKKFIEIDKKILRKNDPETIISDPTKIYKELGWKTKNNMDSFLEKIIKSVVNKSRY